MVGRTWYSCACPGITAARCCSSLKTAGRHGWLSAPTPPRRRKLTGAYCDKFPLVHIEQLAEDTELALETSEPRALLVHTALLAPKTTRSTQGVQVMNIKPKYRLERVLRAESCGITNAARYRTRTIPAAGALLRPEDSEEKQLELL